MRVRVPQGVSGWPGPGCRAGATPWTGSRRAQRGIEQAAPCIACAQRAAAGNRTRRCQEQAPCILPGGRIRAKSFGDMASCALIPVSQLTVVTQTKVSTRPPWPNGQGVGLLIRRLRVRVPQGVTGELRKVWVGEAAAAWKCRDVQQCPHDARAESCVARSSDGVAVAFDHCQRQLRPCAVPHQRSHSLPHTAGNSPPPYRKCGCPRVGAFRDHKERLCRGCTIDQSN